MVFVPLHTPMLLQYRCDGRCQIVADTSDNFAGTTSLERLGERRQNETLQRRYFCNDV